MKIEISPMVLQMINRAHELSEGTDNEEYVRGQAELISQFIPCGDDTGIYEYVIELVTGMISQ